MVEKFFPAYRKLSNNKAFYKINSPDEFEEIQLFGTKKRHYLHRAKLYPEKLKIMDMLSAENGLYLLSSPGEWEDLLER